jgi:two-component system cell cycle sensor histidine kinase/response regulator CckA
MPARARSGPFDTVTRLAQAVTESLELAEVLHRVAEAATEIVPKSAARIWVAERNRLVLRSEAGTGGPPHGGRKTTLTFGEGMAGHVAVTQQPLIIDDLRSEARVVNREWMRRQRCVSAVNMPLIVRGDLVGVLVLMTQRRHRFSRQQVRLLTAFGTHAAIAIQNAGLYAEAQHRGRAAEALADVGRMVSQSLDTQEVGQRIVDSILTLFGAAAAVLYRWEPELDNLVAFSMAGDWGPALDHIVFPAGTGVMGLAVDERRAIVTPDLLTDPRVMFAPDVRARIEQAPSRSVLAVPLIVHGKTVGALGVGRRLGEGFEAAEIRLAQAFGDQAAIALENARIFEEQAELLQSVRRRRARLEALLDVSHEVSRIQPVESLLERIAQTCGDLLHTDSVGIRLMDGDELAVAYTSGGAKDVMATQRLKVGESLSGLVAATGQPLLVTDTANDPRLLPAHRAAMERLGYRALLAVPIKIAESVAGVLSVQTRRHDGFSPEDLQIVTAFADQVGTALNNSRLYDEVQRAYQQLEHTQEQLLQSQKMDAIGRLASGIAHDFNNLLTVITGQSHVLLRQVGPGPVHDGLERISLTADRAADLTRQLLAFSRNQVLQPKILQLNTVISDVTPMLERVIGEDVQLCTVFGDALANVKADASQIQQVVMNLVANARDAMPQGGQLTIETASVVLDAPYVRQHVEVTAGRYVLLAVSDTGVGMDAETRRRLFEPFYTTKEPGKGTGLGLAIVYGIVKQSDGHIWVYSEPGRGTTFKIYLPAVTEGLDTTPGVEASESPRGSETVLLVEDDSLVRQVVRWILDNRGYTVLEAEGPGAALEIATRHTAPIDLLLTDVIMPQMSGRVLADLLMLERPGMAVLFMSGYTANAVVQHGVLDLSKAYLQKPFTPDALARTIRRALDGVSEHPSVAS